MAKKKITPKGIQRRLKTGPSARELYGAPKTFLTTYPANGGSYGGEIEAHDDSEARQLARERRIGERVISAGGKGNSLSGAVELLLKDKPSKKDILTALHESVFMCWIGLEAGTITPREAMSDGGLIHRIVHISLGINDNGTKKRACEEAAKLARELADRVPGWPAHPVPLKMIKTKGKPPTVVRSGRLRQKS